MKKKLFRTLLSSVLLFSVVISGCSSQTGNQAEEAYPTKQIEYVVPFAAGGGVDLVARAVAEYASKEWGQPITVVNKPGGGGAVGAEYALKQAPKDGYTVLADNVSSTSMLEGGLSNPPVKIADRILLSRVVLDPVVFAVKADAPWKDFNEFSEWVKNNPEQLTWTSVGSAGLSAFVVAEWLKAIGVDYSKTRMVATKGASDSIPKVAGGHAILATHTVAETYTMAQAGKIRILAVQAPQRSPYFPDVPTVEEQGIKGVTVKWWTGATVPAGTPAYVVEKWNQIFEKMLKDPAFIEKIKGLHLEVSPLKTDEFTKFVNEETQYYTQLATEGGLRK